MQVIFSPMKSDSMNERATKLLRMAEGMDKRIETTLDDSKYEIRKRASRRLWAAYINELTKIKLGI